VRVAVGLVTLALGANGCSHEAPAPATTVRVVLEDGAGSDSYDAVSRDSACLPGLVGLGSWTVQFSDWKGPRKGLRSLQLVIPQSADTGKFYLGLVFGTLSDGVIYEIDTRPGSASHTGSGSVQIGEEAGGSTLTVIGQTDKGTKVTAVVRCK
jgi:hypothetical protein